MIKLMMDLLMMILGKIMMMMVMVTCGSAEVPLVDQMNLKCFTARCLLQYCATKQARKPQSYASSKLSLTE